ncbi:deoxyribodipyrimidine photolyase [Croceibacterium mercuriale]|uniref:Deoxyribodipyrimidine photolyase n=1 Tax=Croceibacterium mercuriale TaxID=1572751 RepID=A0A0B2C1W0_9SPHN|nr:cryptochrome/photolyase family protein [Croceibacterium mercuriale]KHL26227.1 deoxyribodipyrimidine photolyase [Croceibacterium mercuriale]
MPGPTPQPVLVPILGDQLTPTLSSLAGRTPADTIVLLMEVAEETTYVRHHKAKIALILSAMRHFAAEMRAAGWQVDHVGLEDPANTGSFTGEIARAITRHDAAAVQMVEPGELRVMQALRAFQAASPVPMRILPDDRFICSLPEFYSWSAGRRELRMEFFYRQMRTETGLLMDGAEPAGGQWNYDRDNREPPPRQLDAPPVPQFAPDAITAEVIAMVERLFPHHFGTLAHFHWPVTSVQAEQAAAAFMAQRLPHFGTWQDVMLHGQDDLFHSLLSTSLNLGLLDPLDLCRRAEAEYRAGRAPLNAVEGFIRQLLGWREFIRGMYWLHMPGLRDANWFGATRPLPDFYWTGETDMRCMADCVRSTRDNAHAHHIQRLMVLGNFALIAGISPQELEDWFLVVYADAYEWVELPNVAAMSQFADGGTLASKPYAASGNYINRMSDYCGACRYDVNQKTGPDACPFNPLYWDFMVRNRDRLEPNRRIGRIYANWDRMSESRRADTLASAKGVLDALVPAAPGWAHAQ